MALQKGRPNRQVMMLKLEVQDQAERIKKAKEVLHIGLNELNKFDSNDWANRCGHLQGHIEWALSHLDPHFKFLTKPVVNGSEVHKASKKKSRALKN